MAEIQLDEVGAWTEIKLEIVRKYASAYSKILSSRKLIQRHIYIDGYAGAGRHVSKASGAIIPGSPANALATDPPFSEYHFVDLKSGRVAELKRLKSQHPDLDVKVYEGDCNQILREQVFTRCEYNDYSRGLCLLDPYALNVDWQILETAGRKKTIEIFYNFMIMDANMNVLWEDADKIQPQQAARMDRVWGDSSWRTAAYRTQKGLFSDYEEKRGNRAVASAFQKRLKDAGFAYVADPLPMKNSKGAVVYYLYFASPNKIGHKVATDILDQHR